MVFNPVVILQVDAVILINVLLLQPKPEVPWHE